MKKVLALVLAVLMMVPMFAGMAAAEEPVKIRFINGFTGGDGAFMRKISDGFNASQSQFVVEESQEKDHYVKFETGDYDLVVVHGDLLATYVENGVLQPMNGVYEAAGLSIDDFHAAGKKIVDFDGDLYAMPLDIHPLTMFYNKQLSPEAPKSFADLVALKDKMGANQYVMGVPGAGLVEWYMMFLAAQNNVTVDENGAMKYDTDAFADTLLQLNKLIFEDKLSPSGLGLDGEFNTFMTSEPSDTAVQTAVALTGPWFYSAAKEKYGDDLGVAPLPVIGANAGTYGSAHTIALSAKCTDEKKLEGIAAFFKYMFTTENLLNWADSGQAPLLNAVIEYVGAHPDEYPLPYANMQQFDGVRIAPPLYDVREQSKYLNETVYNLVVTKEGLTKDELMPELVKATELALEVAEG